MIRDWGSTEEERAEAYACDRLEVDGDDVLFRAVDIAAPVPVVYRWLCQLRAAPYSYDLIDNFGKRSPRELIPGLDELAAGQRVMRIFRLASFERDRHLTVILDEPWGRRLFGDLAVTYAVRPREGGARLVVKLLVRRPRGTFRALAPLLPALDLIMMRKQLLTLKGLAEGRRTIRTSAPPGFPPWRGADVRPRRRSGAAASSRGPGGAPPAASSGRGDRG